MEALLNKLRQNGLIDDMGNIILEENMTVDVETFNTFFGDKTFSYTNLIGSHTFTWNGEQMTKTAEELGYKKYFDEWKANGIL